MSQQNTPDPDDREAVEEMLDQDGEDSFPASDPPAHWGGEDAG